MQAFQFYVTDEQAVRSTVSVQTKDAASARVLAERLLANIRYQAVEVWNGGVRLFALEAAEDRVATKHGRRGPGRPATAETT